MASRSGGTTIYIVNQITVPAQSAQNAAASTVNTAGVVNTTATQAVNAVTATGSVRPAIRLPRNLIRDNAGHYVTFNANSGTPAPTSPQRVDANTPVTEPATMTRSGHRFVRWENAAAPGVPFDFNTNITQAITLNAIWIQQHNVTFNANGGTPVPTSPRPVDHNTATTHPDTMTRPGWTFQRWENAASPGTPFNFATLITQPITLNAIWTANTGNVTFNLNGGTGTLPTPLTNRTTGGAWGNMNAAPNINRIGHILMGFGTSATDGEMVFNRYGQLVQNPPQLIMPTGGLVLYAQWVPTTGGFGLAELVAEALNRNFTRDSFMFVHQWEAFSVALYRGQAALSYLPNLSPQQVESIAMQLREAMEDAIS